jgi:hypothetical protein
MSKINIKNLIEVAIKKDLRINDNLINYLNLSEEESYNNVKQVIIKRDSLSAYFIFRNRIYRQGKEW